MFSNFYFCSYQHTVYKFKNYKMIHFASWNLQGAPVKKQSPRKKIPYFRNGSKNMSQTFRNLFANIHTTYLQILLKQSSYTE